MKKQTVREVLEEKMELDVEGIERLYLNLYQRLLQTGAGVAAFFKHHRGAKVASTALMGPMSHAFVRSIRDFAKSEGVEIVSFAKGERKDEVTQQRLQGFSAPEGVLYVGKAQEKSASFRVTKRFSERSGMAFPWLSRGTVLCNHDYLLIAHQGAGHRNCSTLARKPPIGLSPPPWPSWIRRSGALFNEAKLAAGEI